MVINDKIAFVAIPKNASWSVELTCKKYDFDLKYPNIVWENMMREGGHQSQHIHSKIESLLIDLVRI